MSEPRVVVIVPAAGSGSRFGGDIPKQFRTLGGRPLVQRVVERFLFDEGVARVVVPVSEVLLSAVKQSGGDRVMFVAGGQTRLQSVMRGLEHVGEDVDVVVVHDAVRPFFAYETLHAVVAAAREHGAALPVLPVPDTIHVIENDVIQSTPDRGNLAAAQTPQAFRIEVLRDVLARAAQEGGDATDEAGLAARYGYTVRVVKGDSMNFKITRPEDLVMAERVIAEWGDE
ncbi:MAG TPA: 2-C-methyl-D-erythritol 4-phosphate cytidylyltransferase [Thermoanaerobaculia bacterium]|nr:2-C-methyl-D-erythritol 4-phosphate cytidylyltransferase [Thermoanaerobaculia bacterium]